MAWNCATSVATSAETLSTGDDSDIDGKEWPSLPSDDMTALELSFIHKTSGVAFS